MTENNHNSTARGYLSVQAVAQQLAVSPSHVYNLITSGALAAEDLSNADRPRKKKCYRIHPDSLEQMLRRRQVKPQKAPEARPLKGRARRGRISLANLPPLQHL